MSAAQAKKQVIGADVFIVQKEMPKLPAKIGRLKHTLISNRGVKVWPGALPEGDLTDVFRCRYRLETADEAKGTQAAEIMGLLQEIEKAGFEWVHVEKLLTFDGKPGFSKADGES